MIGVCLVSIFNSGREIPLVLSHLETHIAYLKGTVQYVSKHMKENPTVIDPSLVRLCTH